MTRPHGGRPATGSLVDLDVYNWPSAAPSVSVGAMLISYKNLSSIGETKLRS